MEAERKSSVGRRPGERPAVVDEESSGKRDLFLFLLDSFSSLFLFSNAFSKQLSGNPVIVGSPGASGDRGAWWQQSSSFFLLFWRPSELRFQQTYSRTEHLGITNPTTPNSTQSEPNESKSNTRIAFGRPHSLHEEDFWRLEIGESSKASRAPGPPSVNSRRLLSDFPSAADHHQTSTWPPPDAGAPPDCRSSPDLYPLNLELKLSHPRYKLFMWKRYHNGVISSLLDSSHRYI
ncbi:hypothetical protein M5K25_025488 [Dendrobium thyrsiflorum]|uniref:Uncharacterized protein n=1 Tax=Dendrobium thyrsiflorum TaxID=117978 RepID=A0ABD0U442_DENTH